MGENDQSAEQTREHEPDDKAERDYRWRADDDEEPAKPEEKPRWADWAGNVGGGASGG